MKLKHLEDQLASVEGRFDMTKPERRSIREKEMQTETLKGDMNKELLDKLKFVSLFY